MRSVAADYLDQKPDLMAFYGASPRTLLTAPPKPAPWHGDLVAALNAYQEALGTAARVRGDEAVIVTGQQPALFTGPVYTVYKAATAVLLAEKTAAASGVPCVPVFWMGSDDHDFEEARTAHVLTKNHVPLTLQYDPAGDVRGMAMYRVPLDDSLHDLIDTISSETPGSEFRSEIQEDLHDILEKSSSLADWSARLLAKLFEGTPLIIFTPEMPAARRLMAGVFEKEMEDPLESTALLNDAGDRLSALGLERQLQKGDTECNFFVDCGGLRRKVVYEKDVFYLPEEEIRYTKDELVGLLRDSPERFSANVALRCITQQVLFNPAAYVAGPGELAYWAQFKSIFERFGEEMPIVYPRARVVLTSLKLEKLLSKYDLRIADLFSPIDTLIEGALKSTIQNPAYAIAQGKRGLVEEALQEYAHALESSDKQAHMLAEGLTKEVISRMNALEKAIIKSDQSRTETVRQHMQRLSNTFAPFRKPQERVYSVVSFLFKEGWGLVPRLLKELDVESFEINEVEL